MNDNMAWTLPLIAANGWVSIGDVLHTINLLQDANLPVVIVGSDRNPVMASIDWEQNRVYLIDDFCRLSENPVRWTLWLRKISECTSQPILSMPIFEDVAIALFSMGRGLNSLGLILDLAIYQGQSATSSSPRILDRHGAEHGAFTVVWTDGISIDTPMEIQAPALRALKEIQAKSEACGNEPLQLHLFTMQPDDLPADLTKHVRSAPAYIDQLFKNFDSGVKTHYKYLLQD